MFQQQRVKYHRFVWVLWGIAFLHATQAGFCAEQTPRVGTLHIDGAGIERLALQGGTGPPKVFERPEPNLVLAEGSYRLDEVTLPGGYSCPWPQIPAEARVVKISPGTSVTVRLGAPLRQTVRIERWGASLVLKYQLLGQGGESYGVTRRQASKPPVFVIYRGERQVASGDFEPG